MRPRCLMVPLLFFPGPALAASLSGSVGIALTLTRTDAGLRPGFGLDLATKVGLLDGATPTVGVVVHRRWLDEDHRRWMLGMRLGAAVTVGGPFTFTLASLEGEAGVRLTHAHSTAFYLGAHSTLLLALGLGFDLEPDTPEPSVFTAYGAFEFPVPPPVPIVGRPLRAGGVHLLPRALHAVDAPELWVRAGREELASVSVFRRLAAELEAIGAPRALAARARSAAQEELGHAVQCFRIAGGAIARLPPGAPRRYRDRDHARCTIGAECLLDGWGNENRAADTAEAQRDAARDEETARVLDRIATEERGHARLGLDVARWCGLA